MYKNKYGLKFGCDPELFATKENIAPTIPDYAPALPFALSPAVMGNEGFKPLDKEVKHPLYLDGKDYKIVGDGVAYEINLKGPCLSPEEMWEKVNSASFDLQEKLMGYGCSLYKKPVINFDYGRYWKEDMNEGSYEYWSTVFGCDPDQDAFDTNMVNTIEDVSHHPFRYAGGHFHFSGVEEFEKYPRSVIKLLALTVGNYVNSRSWFPDLEKMRAKYYGKPGKYRVQRYPDNSVGVEYRTPSNCWMSFSFDEYKRIFDYVDYAIYLLKNPKAGQKAIANCGVDTVIAILSADKDLSNDVLSRLEV